MKPILLMVVNHPKYFLSHRLPIAEAAAAQGYDVHIASVHGPGGDRIRSLGYSYHVLPISRGSMNPFVEVFAVFKVWQLLAKVRPDVLHLVTLKPVLYGGIAARFTRRVGVITAIAGLGSVYVQSGAKYNLIKFLMRCMFKIALAKPRLRAIFQNMDDRDYLVGLGVVSSDKCIIIRGSGVSLNAYEVKPEPSGKSVVTFAGRLIRDKGIFEFIEAARLLRKKNLGIVFRIAGDIDEGNPSSLSARDLHDLQSAESVELLGYQDDISHIFSDSNIVVLPSYREGLPKVLIEAAACGRAVITTDVPGCRDAIENAVTGLLVPVKDPVALAEAIERLVRDPLLRNRLGTQGRMLAEAAFSIENVVQYHLEAYALVSEGR